MTRVTNTSSMRRSWPSLTNLGTNRGLTLDPGESAETDLPEGFSHAYLKVEGGTPPPTPQAPPPPVPAAPAVPTPAPASEPGESTEE